MTCYGGSGVRINMSCTRTRAHGLFQFHFSIFLFLRAPSVSIWFLVFFCLPFFLSPPVLSPRIMDLLCVVLLFSSFFWHFQAHSLIFSSFSAPPFSRPLLPFPSHIRIVISPVVVAVEAHAMAVLCQWKKYVMECAIVGVATKNSRSKIQNRLLLASHHGLISVRSYFFPSGTTGSRN